MVQAGHHPALGGKPVTEERQAQRVCLVHRRALIEGTLRCSACGQDCLKWGVRDAAGHTVGWGATSSMGVTGELYEGIHSAANAHAPASREEILLARWAQPSQEWSHRRRA